MQESQPAAFQNGSGKSSKLTGIVSGIAEFCQQWTHRDHP
jgi:hypothetical protein